MSFGAIGGGGGSGGGGGGLVADAINDGTTTVAPSQNAVYDALATKADLASPALTGNPTAPTQAQGNNSTRLATTAYVQTEAGLIFEGFSEALALKAPLASPTLTGTVTVPDASFANAKLANMAAKTFKGRHTNSTGAPEDVSAANVLADLIAAAGTPTGSKFIRDDGTLATPPGGSNYSTRTFARRTFT